MDGLLREFVGETLELTEEVAGDLVTWEEAPDDRAALDRIFRAIHTIKGSSSFLDLPRIGRIAHAAEDYLAACRDRGVVAGHAGVSAVLAAVAELRAITAHLASDGTEGAGDDTALLQRLAAAHDGQGGGEARPTAEADIDAAALLPDAWRSVRVPLELVDALMSSVSDLVLARNDAMAQLRGLSADPAAMMALDRISQQLADVRTLVGKMRMVPLRQLFAPLPRLVRQLADELGKRVHLEVSGGEVEIDREMGEALRDPLLHLVRNALDHGIEDPAARVGAGKDMAATLTIAATSSHNRIYIRISDDGRGIDRAALVERTRANGRIDAAALAQMTERNIDELIFLPGLSTRERISDISGRGVGMDVVRANVERLGGHVSLDNRPGEGLTVALEVPLTLTIVGALAVSVGERCFAIPRGAIAEVLLAAGDGVDREVAGGAGLVRVRGELHPLLALEDVLDLQPSTTPADERVILIVRAGGGTVALEADDVFDHEELVIKPLPPVVARSGLFRGMSLPDSGQPLLLLDVEAIVRRTLIEPRREASPSPTAPDRIVSEWITLRPLGGEMLQALPMRSVERFVRHNGPPPQRVGNGLVLQFDGELVPIVGGFDAAARTGAHSTLTVILLRDEQQRIAGLATRELGSITPLETRLGSDGDAARTGIAMIGEEIVEMLSPDHIVASAHRALVSEGVA